jgi:hypothetical protein
MAFGSIKFAILTAVRVLISLLGCDKTFSGTYTSEGYAAFILSISLEDVDSRTIK